MNRSGTRFSIALGICLLFGGIFPLWIAQPVSARGLKEPPFEGPDLSKAIINVADLPGGFAPLQGSQLSSMEGLLKSFQSTLSKTSNATIQNFTGYNIPDLKNPQIIVSGLIAPLSSADHNAVRKALSDTKGLEEAMRSGVGSGEMGKLDGATNLGDVSSGFTMTMSSGSIRMRMEYIVILRQTVIEEVAVMYLADHQPLIGAVNVARILDQRVAAVVGGGGGETFRETSPLVPELTTYIPTPLDISTKPGVIGANLFLAALLMLPFAIAAELITRTMAANEEALRRKFKPLDWVAALQRRLGRGVGSRLHHPGIIDLLKLAGVMFFYGLVFSLLERNWNPFSLAGVMLFVQMTVAYGVVGIADDILQWLALRRWGLHAELTVRPTNVMLAAVSTTTSRVFALVPGLMFGTPEALDFDESTLDADKRSRLLKISAATFIVLVLVFWIPTIVTGLLQRLSLPATLADLIGGLEALLLVVFAVALENTFVRMIGFPGGFGEALKRKNRWLWFFGLAAVSFLFFHTLINPRGGLASAVQEGNVLVLMIAAGAFLLVSFGLWLTLGRKGIHGDSEAVRVPTGQPAAPSRAREPSVPSISAPTDGRAKITGMLAAAGSHQEAVSGESRPCPFCGETIKSEARICRFCRATFEVHTRGYCLNCHDVVSVLDGRCQKCSREVVDVHYEIKTLTAPPKSHAPQLKTVPNAEPVMDESAVAADTKLCPVCGQTIKSEAKICRFCRTRFDASATLSQTPPKTVPQAVPKIEEDSPSYGPARCPKCKGGLDEREGSPVSSSINTYTCAHCGWMGFRCGKTGCTGFMKSEEIGFPNTVRYICVKCGWTGTGPRVGI